MDTKPLTIDGYLDTVPTPGDAAEPTRFQLITSPTDDIADDTVWSCTTGDPHIAYALLTELQPGDLLRVSGHLVQPNATSETARLTVDALEVLTTAPLRVLHEMVLNRYGPYLCVFDADTDTIPVFTEDGVWVGTATSPDTIGDLIDAFEDGGES